MKKCILLILSFCFIFLMSIEANANIIPDYTGNETSLFYVDDEKEFNIIVGCPDNFMTNSPFYYYADYLSSKMGIISGGFCWGGKIYAKDNPSINADYYAEFKTSYNSVASATVKLDDKIIYHMETTGCDDPSSDINEEIDLNDYFKTEGLVFKISSDVSISETSDYESEHNYQPDYNEHDFGLKCLIGAIYKKNTVYEGKDLYFVTSVVSPITEEEILNSIIITDQTEGTISNKARIAYGTYKLTEGKIGIGTYTLVIAASDSAGNITVQKCFITVADITPPTINANNVETEYCSLIDDLESLFIVEDNSGYYTVSIIENEYTDNYDHLGEYNVTLKATDEALNEATASIIIKVVDKISPTLIVKDVIASTTNPLKDKFDLLEYIICEDFIDGTDTIVEIEDTDLYFNTPTELGTYTFSIKGYDKSGNVSYGHINLRVYDTDYPEIYADTYTITINKGENLSVDAIKNMLIQIGQINSLDDVLITSSYFDTPDVCGSYDLIILTPSGVYKDVINVKDNSNINDLPIDTIDFTIPSANNSKDLTYIYVISSIIGILIISSVGIIIYKRKH